MKRFLSVLAILSALSGVFGTAHAQGEPLKVVASFSILADVVKNVGLNNVQVTSLIPVGADPHSYEPSAQDLRVLAEADVVFVVGANFEEALLEAITNTVGESIPVIEASACVPIRAFGAHDDDHEGEETHTDEVSDEHSDEESHDHQDEAHTPGVALDFETLCAAHDAYLTDLNVEKSGMLTSGFDSNAVEGTLGRLHDIDCGAGHDHATEESDHEQVACDPHVWTNPYNVYLWTLMIRDILGQLDGDDADLYAANAEEYLYQLIDHIVLNIVPLIESTPAGNRILVTSHETLGYFSAAYGFEMVGFVLPGGSAFAEPSAQDVAALVDLIRAEGVPAVFAETTISAVVAEQVAAEAGVAFYSLYTDSLSRSDGDAPTYLDYLTFNVQTITGALAISVP